MYIYTDYENRVIFISYNGTCDSVYELETRKGQLIILGFERLSNRLWKLDVKDENVFNYLVVQVNIILKPEPLSKDLVELCLAVNEHQQEVEKPVAEEMNQNSDSFVDKYDMQEAVMVNRTKDETRELVKKFRTRRKVQR